MFTIVYMVKAKKRYGQNFLKDDSVLNGIIEAAGITKEDDVLEIGPGTGSLTKLLCRAAGSVTAVEIDRELIPVLKKELGAFENFTLIQGDILKTELEELFDAEKPLKVVANLPYYITTPIIMKLLESSLPMKSLTVMVQKEVALRMAAAPGTSDYGALSLAVQYRAKTEYIMTVPPECFYPSPSVDSAVVRLDMYTEPPVKAKDPEKMFALIRLAFNQRRKTLANASGDRARVAAALEELGLNPMIRGEALGLEEFAKLSDAL
ncbi:MAG: 16S rRNA (adenine(1518)-N(6)/adenine(1519)-N(6))-dimethyltransferase RsmA [Lachnospiraceae bacterium]|nr:16S rRNA (adenine(1518)-N(6)/adenine(1519)-N(6))-dimethyltransferase RsmA [Lachnospiraceae bacterium]